MYVVVYKKNVSEDRSFRLFDLIKSELQSGYLDCTFLFYFANTVLDEELVKNNVDNSMSIISEINRIVTDNFYLLFKTIKINQCFNDSKTLKTTSFSNYGNSDDDFNYICSVICVCRRR